MNTFKWTNPRYFMCFSPDGDGAAAPSGGDGGSSVSPSSADGGGSSVSLEPGSSATPSEADPWGGLETGGDSYDEIEVPVAASVAPETPVVPVAPVPPAPVEGSTPTPPAPVAPNPPAHPQDPTSSSPAPAAPQLSPSDPVGIVTAMEQSRDAVIAHLAESRFALTETDIAELESNAAVAVPKLLARAMYETQTTMYRFLAQAVPGMIERHQTVAKANSSAEEKFFTTHKDLGLKMDDPKHREVATRMAKAYKQMNPQVTLDQMISDIGPMVAMALKLSPIPNQPTPPNPRMPAFRPAVGGGGASPAPADANEWAGLGQDFDED